MQVAQVALLFLRQHHRPNRVNGVQLIFHALEQRALANGVLVPALGRLRSTVQSSLNSRKVGQRKLRVDRLYVRKWIDLTGNVNDVCALEAPHDV